MQKRDDFVLLDEIWEQLFQKLEDELAKYDSDFNTTQMQLAHFMIVRLTAHKHRNRAGEQLHCLDPEGCLNETAAELGRLFQLMAREGVGLVSTDAVH